MPDALGGSTAPAVGTAGVWFASRVALELGGVQAHMAAAVAGEADGVHQMRVALRRLRALLKLFAPVLERRAAGGFNQALRDLGRVLGEARDWDVFETQTRPGIGAPWPAVLVARAGAAREAAHERLRAGLMAPEFAALVGGLTVWSRAAVRPDIAGSLVDLAPGLLDRLARKVARRGRRIAHLDGEALHELRKALKTLRYAGDAVSAPFVPRAVVAFGRDCRRLQELLGDINDAAASVALTRRLAGDDIALRPAVALVEARAGALAEAAGASLVKARRRFAGTAPFWRAP